MSTHEVRGFLDAPATGVLSTIGLDGWPHSTAMWFVPRDDELLMWTYRRSQKVVNIRRDPRVALLVEDGSEYDKLRGVLVQGTAEILDSFDEVRSVGVALYDRYTKPSLGLDVAEGPIAEIERQARKRVALLVPMTRVASWDHSKL
jgi:PPOX class probable F420-dependent enzyme